MLWLIMSRGVDEIQLLLYNSFNYETIYNEIYGQKQNKTFLKLRKSYFNMPFTDYISAKLALGCIAQALKARILPPYIPGNSSYQ